MTSSTLQGFPKFGLAASHTDICKFAGPTDANYRAIVDTIKGLVTYAPTRQLWKAIALGAGGSIGVILAAGADPNLPNAHGKSALHQAVETANKSVIMPLLAQGADVNLLDRDGKSALHIAVAKANEEPVETANKSVIMPLLAQGADVNLLDRDGKSAQHIAVAKANEDIVLLLLKGGANVDIQDKNHTSARDAAQNIQSLNVKTLLQGTEYIEGPRLDRESSFTISVKQAPTTLDPDQQAACEAFTATITSFCPSPTFPLRRYPLRTSVYEALYSPTSKDIIPARDLPVFTPFTSFNAPVVSEQPELAFTWYHLPANNVRHAHAYPAECSMSNQRTSYRWRGLR